MSQLLAVLQKLWLTAFLLIQSALLLYFVSIFFEPRGVDFIPFLATTVFMMTILTGVYFAGAGWMRWMFTATRRAP